MEEEPEGFTRHYAALGPVFKSFSVFYGINCMLHTDTGAYECEVGSYPARRWRGRGRGGDRDGMGRRRKKRRKAGERI